MKKLLLLILLLIAIISCSKEDETTFESAETIIFGEIYGECGGDCRILYLLTELGVYGDSNTNTDFGDWENTSFDDKELSSNKFELAKPLLEIPTGLIDNNDDIEVQILADFDYYLNIKIDGKSKTWIFDEINENTESAIKEYFDKLIQIDKELRNQ